MGTPRVVFDATDLVISKTGKDATDPTLPDTDKIFDSKWLFGLQVLGFGVWVYPLPATTYRDFTLPNYGFRPALMLRTKVNPSYSIDGFGDRIYAEYGDRLNQLTFTGVNLRYDRERYGNPPRFLNDTTVRLYGVDSYSVVEYHWTAIAI